MEVRRRYIVLVVVVAPLAFLVWAFWRNPGLSEGASSPSAVSVTIKDDALDHVLDGKIKQMQAGANEAIPHTKMIWEGLPDFISLQVYIPENKKCFVDPLWAIEITSVVCDGRELQPVLVKITYNYLERRMFIASGGFYCFRWCFEEFESAVRDETALDGYRSYRWQIPKNFTTMDIKYIYRGVDGEKIAENVFQLIRLPPVMEELPSRPFMEKSVVGGAP